MLENIVDLSTLKKQVHFANSFLDNTGLMFCPMCEDVHIKNIAVCMIPTNGWDAGTPDVYGDIG